MKLFGYTFKDKKKEEGHVSFAPPSNEDGSLFVGAVGDVYNLQANFDAKIINENDLILKYRRMALIPEAESAIDDIVDDAIVADDMRVTVNLDNIDELGEPIKKKIRDEFDNVLNLLDWDNKGSELFRRWYVEGRLYYHKIVDPASPKKGILELRPIDSTCIKKVKQLKRSMQDGLEVLEEMGEYYNYSKFGHVTQSANAHVGVKISSDAIAYIHSGLFNENRTVVLSHLHKALKPFNQLQMLEDAAVIYRITRAPERRAFYIDVGSLPTQKAETYVNNLMNRFKNKLTYDSATGEIRDSANVMSIVEDFWLPRREGGKGTEITTLQGGTNLGEMTDVEYFQKKFYKALKVPISRLATETSFNIGRSSEITRDEIKFYKFIRRLRKRFSLLFDDVLYTQLVLKGIISEKDWVKLKERILYDWPEDSHFSELKNMEILTDRINLLGNVQPYVGKYFSNKYVRKEILQQTDDDIERITTEIEEEVPEQTEEQPPQDEQQPQQNGDDDGQQFNGNN